MADKKIWLKKQNQIKFSTYNREKSDVAERFITTLKNKIYKHMTAIYLDLLDDIIDKYTNTYHNTIKMKSIDVKPNFYAEYNVDSNAKDSKFKIGDILEFKSIKTFLLNDMLFFEKELQMINQTEFRIGKVIKEREISSMLNGKAMIINLIEKTLYKMSQYFPKLYEPFGVDINVKIDLSNYATKTDLKKLQKLIHLNWLQNLI